MTPALRWIPATATFVCLALIGVPLLGPDTGPGAAVAQDEGPRALVILEEEEPQTTYPLLSRTMSEARLGELLFDRFFFTTSGGDIESRVFAEGWGTRSPNLTITVRDGLKFSDGTAATFSDVAFTINDVYRRADLGHPSAPWYAKVFGDSQQITPTTGSVRYLVSMPDEGAERYLVTTTLLSRAALMGEAGKSVDLVASRRQPVGTGPFHAAAPIDNFDDVTLQRNPHRLTDEEPDSRRVDAVRLLYDQDAARQKELLEGGRADVWVAPPPAVLPGFRADRDRFGVRTYDLNQWWYLAVDPANPHLSVPGVREALDRSVPRQQLREKLGADSAELTSGPFLPGSAWLPGDLGPTPEDRDGARQLMEAAGYAHEGGRWMKDGEEVSLQLGVEGDILDDFNDVVYGLVDGWEDAGFRVRVRAIRSSDWRNLVEAGQATGNWDLILGRWNLDREEAALELFRKPQGSGIQVNLFGWSHSEVDGIVRDFYAETSGPAREALMQKLHRLVSVERPYLFLWSLKTQSVYRRDRVTGFRASPYYFYSRFEGIAWKEAASE
jgi:peptide/nickel transport system substrate-binding protein